MPIIPQLDAWSTQKSNPPNLDLRCCAQEDLPMPIIPQLLGACLILDAEQDPPAKACMYMCVRHPQPQSCLPSSDCTDQCGWMQCLNT